MTEYSSYTPTIFAATLAEYTPLEQPLQMHLFILNPTPIFRARVNMTPPSGVIDAVTYTPVGIGVYTDIRPGQTICFGSAQGRDDYGRQRIRKPATADTLYIGRSSTGTHDGEVTIVDDAYITVLDDFRMWAKIPDIIEISDTEVKILKDSDLEVEDNTTNPPPVANSGPGFAATIRSDTELITVTLPIPGTNSFPIADGAFITSYLWEIDDGTLVSGSLTDAEITATFPAGFRWAHLTVTDTNGKTHTSHTPIFARDPFEPADETIREWQMESRTVMQLGQKIALKIISDVDMSVYPDGTLVMIWDREPNSPIDRNHMVMVGWMNTETELLRAEANGYVRDSTFFCVDGAGKLDLIPGLPVSVANDLKRIVAKQPVITWAYMVNPTLLKYWHYLIHWHTTALELLDWIQPLVGAEYTFVNLSSEGESVLDQLSRRAKVPAPNYVLTVNQSGQLGIIVDPQTQNVEDRTNIIQATLTEDDWSDIRYTLQRTPKLHWLRGKAILSHPTTVAAVFAHAPGLAPGQGVGSQDVSEQLVLSQQDLNDVTGHQYARANAPQSEFRITLIQDDDAPFIERPWRNLDPAAMTWTLLNISFEYASQRGLNFTNARGLIKEVTTRYNYTETGITRTVEVLWERETVGIPATTYIPKPVTPADPGNWPTEPVVPYVPDQGLVRGVQHVTIISDTGWVYRTHNFQNASPTWAQIDFQFHFDDYTFVVDPFSPQYRDRGPFVNGYVANSDSVSAAVDIFGMARWGELFNATDFSEDFNLMWRSVDASFGRFLPDEGDNPWILVSSYISRGWADAGPKAASNVMFSADGGHTQHDGIAMPEIDGNEIVISTHYDTNEATHGRQQIGLYLSPKTPGYAITIAYDATTSPATGVALKTTDWGLTWSELANPLIEVGHSLGFVIHVPWDDNDDESIVYHGWADRSGNLQYQLRRVNGLLSENISPVLESKSYGVAGAIYPDDSVGLGSSIRHGGGKFGVRAFDSGRRFIALAGMANGASSSIDDNVFAAFLSSNYGDSFTPITEVFSASDPHPQEVAFSGTDPSTLFLWGTKGYIAYTEDFGVNVLNKMGNLASFGDLGNIIGIVGTEVIDSPTGLEIMQEFSWTDLSAAPEVTLTNPLQVGDVIITMCLFEGNSPEASPIDIHAQNNPRHTFLASHFGINMEIRADTFYHSDCIGVTEINLEKGGSGVTTALYVAHIRGSRNSVSDMAISIGAGGDGVPIIEEVTEDTSGAGCLVFMMGLSTATTVPLRAGTSLIPEPNVVPIVSGSRFIIGKWGTNGGFTTSGDPTTIVGTFEALPQLATTRLRAGMLVLSWKNHHEY